MALTQGNREPAGSGNGTNLPCPKCGAIIDCMGLEHPVNVKCPECQTLLWCRKRIEQDVVLLDVIPGTSPEISDIATVGRSLQASRTLDRVVVNLHDVEMINSSFVAGLLVMRRLIEAAGGKLVLCDLRPRVQVILQRLKLHTFFIIANCVSNGVKSV